MEPAFRLPEQLPFPYATSIPLPKTITEWDKPKLERELSALLEKGVWPTNPNDSEDLLLFFRAVAQDYQWMDRHATLTEKIFSAASQCLFNPELSNPADKVRQIVKNFHSQIAGHLPKDTNFQIGPTTFQDSALALATGSPFFAELFRSGFKEGRGNLASIPIQDVDPQVFENFAFFLEHGRAPKGFAPTDEQIAQLIEFSNRMGSDELILPILNELLEGREFDKETAELIYPWSAVNYAGKIRRACFESLLATIKNPQQLHTLITLVKKHEPKNRQDLLLADIDKRLKLPSPVSNSQEWIESTREKELLNLHRECLQFVFRNLDDVQAFAILKQPESQQPFQMNGFVLTEAEAKTYCQEWLLAKAEKSFQDLEHKWDPDKNQFDKTLSRLTHALHSSSKEKEALQFLKELKAVLPMMRSLTPYRLTGLTSRELNWILRAISPLGEQLDLSGTSLQNLEVLERFRQLRQLCIQGCKDAFGFPNLPKLEELDLRDCPKYFDLQSFAQYPQLKKLSIRTEDFFGYDVKTLHALSKLQTLDLRGCPESLRYAALSQLKNVSLIY